MSVPVAQAPTAARSRLPSPPSSPSCAAGSTPARSRWPLAAGDRPGRARAAPARPGSARPSSRSPRRCCSAPRRSTTGARGRRGSHGLLKRLDHSNIFLIIAGTYTPFALLLLPPTQSRSLLLIAWAGRHRRGAVPGLLGRRAALALHADLRRARLGRGVLPRAALPTPAAPRSSSLIAVGGLLYTLGAVVYGTKRPEPLTALVRLPRDLPRVHRRRVRRALRRRVDGGLRLRRRLTHADGRAPTPALTGTAQLAAAVCQSPRGCPRCR